MPERDCRLETLKTKDVPVCTFYKIQCCLHDAKESKWDSLMHSLKQDDGFVFLSGYLAIVLAILVALTPRKTELDMANFL